MGGGHVSRPDFGMPQPDPDHPLTEFYLLLQHTLDRAGVFALPALYAGFQAPARRIYPDEAADYLTLSETEQEGMTRLLAPSRLQLLYSSLHVAPDGTPAALLLTDADRLTICNIGDSKIFRLTDRQLTQISEDHLSLAPAGVKPPLSQCLGIPPEELTLCPHYDSLPCCAGDKYLLCSDGLTDMVPPEAIRDTLAAHAPADAAPGPRRAHARRRRYGA